MIIINIYRPNVTAAILSAKPNNTSSAVKQTVMGDNLLSLNFYLDKMIDLRIGDYADVYGARYYIHGEKIPLVSKDSTYGYEYNFDMVSSQYLLKNAQYLTKDDSGNYTVPDFSLYQTADGFIDLLIANANRIGITWKKGGIIQTDFKNLTFSKQDCLSVLAKLSEEFGTEWFVEGIVINLSKKLVQKPFTFKYGLNKGMYEIKRLPADNTSIVTRLYVFGGTQNIPIQYRNGAMRLLLPAISNPLLVTDVTYNVTNNGNGTETIVYRWTAPVDPSITRTTVNMRLTTGTVTAYTVYNQNIISATPSSTVTVPVGTYEVFFETFTGTAGNYVSAATTQTIIIAGSNPYPVLPGSNQPYIEYNTSLYGIIENTLIFDDIYPHRTGIVTAVDATNPYLFSDSTLDFDINNQLLPGTAAKVTFNTGQLAGYSFEIKSYDPNTFQFYLLKNKDEKTLDIPSTFFRPVIGDEYVLVDIYMPQSYIDAAESLLLSRAQDCLNTYSAPVYSYAVTCDPKYFRLNKIQLSYGDVVTITDNELGINRAIRILSVTKRLDDEYNYSLELGEAVSSSLITQIQNSISTNSNSISNVNNALDNKKILNGENVGDFKVSQGTVIIPDIVQATSTAGLSPLYIDSAGKIFKV